MKRINDITSMVKHIMQPFVKKANIAVDCTCGNGYDSVFILENLPQNSNLYAFDIQKEAIETTKKKLQAINSSCKNFYLINDSHTKIEDYIKQPIDIAFFNLGYLPGADHSISTKKETTIKALDICIKKLSKNGVISILIYSGHDSGKIERNALLKYFETINHKKIKLMRIDFPTSPNNPPEIYVLQRLKN